MQLPAGGRLEGAMAWHLESQGRPLKEFQSNGSKPPFGKMNPAPAWSTDQRAVERRLWARKGAGLGKGRGWGQGELGRDLYLFEDGFGHCYQMEISRKTKLKRKQKRKSSHLPPRPLPDPPGSQNWPAGCVVFPWPILSFHGCIPQNRASNTLLTLV